MRLLGLVDHLGVSGLLVEKAVTPCFTFSILLRDSGWERLTKSWEVPETINIDNVTFRAWALAKEELVMRSQLVVFFLREATLGGGLFLLFELLLTQNACCAGATFFEICEHVVRNLVLVFNEKDGMKLFVGPVEVLVDLEQHHRGHLREDRFFALFEVATILEHLLKLSSHVRSDSKVQSEVQLHKLLSI